MRLAYLVLTHAYPELLGRLVGRLANDDTDVYIHLDLKTDITPFLYLKETKNVFFIKNRVKVNWAGYSIVQATLNGFKEILASRKQYGHISLLSGQHYPLKSAAEIHNFFANNSGKIFIQARSVENEWHEAIPRITAYHMPDRKFRGKDKALGLINRMVPKRKMPMALTAMGGSQWLSITPAGAAYIIDFMQQNPKLERFFKLSWAPDEMIFGTILFKSPFKKDMVNDNLVYMDWSAGGASPKVFTMEDADRLKNADKLFARKFNLLTDRGIVDYLDSITQ